MSSSNTLKWFNGFYKILYSSFKHKNIGLKGTKKYFNETKVCFVWSGTNFVRNHFEKNVCVSLLKVIEALLQKKHNSNFSVLGLNKTKNFNISNCPNILSRALSDHWREGKDVSETFGWKRYLLFCFFCFPFWIKLLNNSIQMFCHEIQIIWPNLRLKLFWCYR